MSSEWNYTDFDLKSELPRVGITKGATVFVHVCLESLGQLKDVSDGEGYHRTVLEALRSAVGEEGTILIPNLHILVLQSGSLRCSRHSDKRRSLEHIGGFPGVLPKPSGRRPFGRPNSFSCRPGS